MSLNILGSDPTPVPIIHTGIVLVSRIEEKYDFIRPTSLDWVNLLDQAKRPTNT